MGNLHTTDGSARSRILAMGTNLSVEVLSLVNKLCEVCVDVLRAVEILFEGSSTCGLFLYMKCVG